MSTFLMVGTVVGFIIGLFHACYVYTQRTKEDPIALSKSPAKIRAGAAYFALWTLILWTAFGAYVFNLWLLSVVVYGIYRGIKRLSETAVPNSDPILNAEAK